MKNLYMKKLVQEAKLPTRNHPDDAGLDVYGLETVVLGPREGKAFRTGIAIELEEGYVALVCDRSSLGKKGIKCAGGVIDAGYRGEIQILLWNLTDQKIELQAGDRIAQILILPIATPAPLEAEELTPSARGAQGFGSSGR